MRPFYWHKRYGVLVLLLAFFLSWQLSRQSVEPGSDRVPDLSVVPDFFVRNSHGLYIDRNAGKHYRISADEIRHFDGGDMSIMSQPSIEISKKGHHYWSVQAREGVFMGDQEQVSFQGDVVMRSEADSPAEVLTIHSETILVDLSLGIASTSDRVRIDHANGQTVAQGMRADFNRRQVGLLENVRSRINSAGMRQE